MLIQESHRRRARVAPVSLLILVFVAAALGALAGCAVDNNGGVQPLGPNVADCMGCHGDKDMLVATAAPDTSGGSEGSGEG